MPMAKGALAAQEEEMPEGTPQDASEDVAEGEGPEGSPENDRADAAEGEDGPQAKELFDLVVGRTLEALAQDAEGLDAALKADPVRGAVSYGTKALHAIASSAEGAGRPIDFGVLVQAGMQVIKVLAGIANDKGYLPDEQIETFLKEVFQQSLVEYVKMDVQTGKIDQKTMAEVSQMMGGGQPGAPAAPTAGPPQGALASMPGGA